MTMHDIYILSFVRKVKCYVEFQRAPRTAVLCTQVEENGNDQLCLELQRHEKGQRVVSKMVLFLYQLALLQSGGNKTIFIGFTFDCILVLPC